MKIVSLIKPAPPLFYFANRIHREHGQSLVVVQKGKASRRIVSRARLRCIYRKVKTLGIVPKEEKRQIATYQAMWGDEWKALNPDIPVMEAENLNSDEVHARLTEMRPDLILDHGTDILKNRIIDTAELALNLHWGLAPFYRGTHCTGWAIINWDPHNIGVTIHKLTKDIDGGAVLAQQRATVTPEDTLHSINMQLTDMGTDLIVEIIRRIKNGTAHIFTEQNLARGFLTHTRQWSPLLTKQIAYLEENGLIGAMLKHPSRAEKVPILDLGPEFP